MLTWLLAYLAINCIFAAVIVAMNYKDDPEGTKVWAEDQYKRMPSKRGFKTLTIVSIIALFAIPSFIYESIQGGK